MHSSFCSYMYTYIRIYVHVYYVTVSPNATEHVEANSDCPNHNGCLQLCMALFPYMYMYVSKAFQHWNTCTCVSLVQNAVAMLVVKYVVLSFLLVLFSVSSQWLKFIRVGWLVVSRPRAQNYSMFPFLLKVRHQCKELLQHKMITILLDYKWTRFGVWFYLFNLLLYLTFVIFLTGFALALPNPQFKECK